MTLEYRKTAFIELGKFLGQFQLNKSEKNKNVNYNDVFFDDFLQLIKNSKNHNGWYTEEHVFHSVNAWAKALTTEKIEQWVGKYNLQESKGKTVGLILAGNIPLVGFHDFLSVIISGHRALIKTSSNDQHLLPFLAKYLINVAPEMKDYIVFTENKLEHFDAVIATGSNNTARYFEYYFKDKPSIIRKNRNSIAILTGNESKNQLIALGNDIFTYFGLGCRNVSKLFVPENYNFDDFFNAMFEYKDIIEYEKYANNYDYNKAVFLMSNFKLLDNGFLTLKEDVALSSPISSVFYERYNDLQQLTERIENDKEKIQCIVSDSLLPGSIDFGKTQQPELWDYADNVDTLLFLSEI